MYGLQLSAAMDTSIMCEEGFWEGGIASPLTAEDGAHSPPPRWRRALDSSQGTIARSGPSSSPSPSLLQRRCASRWPSPVEPQSPRGCKGPTPLWGSIGEGTPRKRRSPRRELRLLLYCGHRWRVRKDSGRVGSYCRSRQRMAPTVVHKDEKCVHVGAQ